MNKQWKFWMLASALAFGVACGDDDGPSNDSDAGETDAGTTDAGKTPEVDAGDEEEEADAGDEEVDAGDEEVDAGETPDAAEPEPLEIAGRWHSNYGGTFEFSDTLFQGDAVLEYDNDENVVYTQKPADDTYNPSKFTKSVWTEIADGTFYSCTIVYAAETLADAKASDLMADDTALTTVGCNGFPWTIYGAPFELEGEFTDQFAAGTYTIDSDEWDSTFGAETYPSEVVSYDNITKTAYLQDKPVATGKFSKIVWVEVGGSFYYCTVAFTQDSIAAADTNAQPAIETSPATAGCGDMNVAWTQLIPATSN